MPIDPSSFPAPPEPQTTGRTIVRFKHGADVGHMTRALDGTVSRVQDARDFGEETTALDAALDDDSAVVLPRFAAAVVAPKDDGARITALSQRDGVAAVRPEFFMFSISTLEQRYQAWMRDGLRLLIERGPGTAQPAGLPTAAGADDVPFADTAELTWGLIATGAHRSTYKGKGIKVCVLDTGLDLEHPDFADRDIVHRSFVSGETVDDVQGHGTHCAGTVAGPMCSRFGRRYGVAPDVELFIGKVLNNRGSGREADILRAMDWAIEQACVVISMSLGRPTRLGEPPDPIYEEVGRAALEAQSLVIAAAGNESQRQFGLIAPVGAPANAPSIMAIAAVDPMLDVAFFSCGGRNPNGGEVNVSGPGVSVYSSYPLPRGSNTLQGTSMACPHVAGIAALLAESDPELRGERLWQALERTARELGGFSDFGRGLVQAPTAPLVA